MHSSEIILSFLIVVSAMGTGLIGYAQPNIPKENIPADVREDVRQQIERLYSSDPVERGYAADHLKGMGERAAPAIPFLIEVLKDEASYVRWCAAGALGWIGDERAVEPLIVCLKDKDSDVRGHAASALWKITGKYFGEDPVKWQEWWEENKAKTVTPTPLATGVVHGVLIDESTGQPVINEQVVLATVTEIDEDNNSFTESITWDEQGKLLYSAYTETAGTFTIEAPPGTYVLEMSSEKPFSSGIVRIDGTIVLFINIEAGQTIDVGEIKVTTK